MTVPAASAVGADSPTTPRPAPPDSVESWAQSVIQRKRQAVLALSGFSLAFFVVGLTLTISQSIRHGYGVIDGRLREGDRIDVQGTGLYGDSAILALTIAANVLLMIAWRWIGERVGDDRN